MAMTTYPVRAERDGKWWVLTVPLVPGAVAQARRLDQAPEEIRSAIAMILECPESEVQVDVDVVLSGDELARLRELKDAQREAERTREVAARASRAFVADLGAQGMTVRDIGAVMGTSPQRAQQLLAEVRASAKRSLG